MKKPFQLLVIGSIIFIVLLMLISNNPNNDSKKNVDNFDACSAAQYFIKEKLKSPSTAVFQSYNEMRVSREGNDFVVSGYVDSQNGFGAMLRSDFMAVMKYHPDAKNWTLEDYTFGTR